MDSISIRGAKVHNLKNIDVCLPRNKLVVITGLSGSGKSSLAFDTIYAEGQRRYVESLSAYARQFLSLMEKPDVDHIEGLSPAISNKRRHHTILDRLLEPSQKFMTTLDFCLPEWALQDVQTMAMSFKHKLFHRWLTLF